MLRVSNAYKDIMNRPIRNRGYISVVLGVINQEAQRSASYTASTTSWSKGNIFDDSVEMNTYATLDEKFMKADGSMLFMPENGGYLNNGITFTLGQSVTINFGEERSIRGLTIDWGEAYPTSFTIVSESANLSYTGNTKSKWTTTDVIGDTTYIIITPTEMVGGTQRPRIKLVQMGIGIEFTNETVKEANLQDFASSISDEVSYAKYTVTAYDTEGVFNVDSVNSFTNFLGTMQTMTIYFGLEMDDGSIEWFKKATGFLSEWDSEEGIVTVTATDRLSQLDDNYESGYTLGSRTAYQAIVDILTDAGMEADEYIIDDYLKNITITNPIPKKPHRACLQTIANASRSVIYENPEGQLVIQTNFANTVDPDDLEVSSTTASTWSTVSNLFDGTSYEYADLTYQNFRCDGTMVFMPEDGNYVTTSFTSSAIASSSGAISTGFTVELPYAFSYSGFSMAFGGCVPKTLVVTTYKGTALQETKTFTNLTRLCTIYYDFLAFDKMVFTFTETEPGARVVVKQLTYGDFTDYYLTRDLMISKPHGYQEKRVKEVKVKIYTYHNDDQGIPLLDEDEVYYTKTLNPVGVTKVVQNPLISSEEMAENIAGWIGNYYENNATYDVNFRGDPRLQAADIIHMESDALNNLQVEIHKNELTFNGSWSGVLELRKALKLID